MEKKKGLIVVDCMGGLGNRMRAMAAGFSLSRNQGKSFEAIWHPSKELNATFNDLFNSAPVVVKTPSEVEYMLRYGVPRKKNLYLSAVSRRVEFDKCFHDSDGKFISTFENEDAFEAICAQASKILINSDEPFYRFDKSDLDCLFAPNDTVKEMAAQMGRNLTPRTVGVHIRRTDNLQSIANSPLELFESVLAKKLNRGEFDNFYLATDDISVKEYMKDRFGNKVITSDINLRRDETEGVRLALAEMIVLGRTAKILGSYYSSYSEMAALWSDTPLNLLQIDAGQKL